MTRRCARTSCQWQSHPDAATPPRAQAEEHAADTGHDLCAACSRSLADDERRTCEKCITRAHKALQNVVELYAVLPEQTGHPAAQVYDRGRGGGADDGAPLPGGVALVLLAAGGTGAARRRLTPGEIAQGLVPGLDGREHLEDNVDDDGVSVAHFLASWEDDWRHTRGEPAASTGLRPTFLQWWLPGAVGPLTAPAMRRLTIDGALAGPSTTERTVVGAAGYLERRMRWAANEHDDFPAFVEELEKVQAQLQHVTSTSSLPLRAPAPCIDCGEKKLQREYRAPDACDCERPPTGVPAGPEPRYVRLERHRLELERWDAAHTCDQGGLVEHWTCAGCGREYSEKEYHLALADWMQEVAASGGWGRPWEVAASLRLPSVKTVRNWIDRQEVTVCCEVTSRRLMVWWPDARRRAEELRLKRLRAEEARLRREQRRLQREQQEATA